MPKHKIEHNKPECIGCGVCAAIAENFWEMEEEGKSHLKNSIAEENKEVLEIDDEHIQINKEAAEACPVNIIHIKDKNGKQIV